jgi:hypothetical protein
MHSSIQKWPESGIALKTDILDPKSTIQYQVECVFHFMASDE